MIYKTQSEAYGSKVQISNHVVVFIFGKVETKASSTSGEQFKLIDKFKRL